MSLQHSVNKQNFLRWGKGVASLGFWQRIVSNKAIWPVLWQRQTTHIVYITNRTSRTGGKVYWTNKGVVRCPFQLGWSVSLLRAISIRCMQPSMLIEMHFPGIATPCIGVSSPPATWHMRPNTLRLPNMETTYDTPNWTFPASFMSAALPI